MKMAAEQMLQLTFGDKLMQKKIPFLRIVTYKIYRDTTYFLLTTLENNSKL